jgi:hypothetical protein
MPTTTADQQITRPIGADAADVPAEVVNWLAAVETRLNLRYANFADRASRHTVQVEGDITDLAAEDRADAWNGSAYISRTIRGYYAWKIRTTNAAAINNSTVLVADSTLTVALGEANRTYRFGGRLYFDAAAAADLKMTLVFPAAATLSKWGIQTADTATLTSLARTVVTASGTTAPVGAVAVGTTVFVDFEGVITLGATTGNLQVQYAQNTADASNLTVQAGSELWVLTHS